MDEDLAESWRRTRITLELIRLDMLTWPHDDEDLTGYDRRQGTSL